MSDVFVDTDGTRIVKCPAVPSFLAIRGQVLRYSGLFQIQAPGGEVLELLFVGADGFTDASSVVDSALNWLYDAAHGAKAAEPRALPRNHKMVVMGIDAEADFRSTSTCHILQLCIGRRVLIIHHKSGGLRTARLKQLLNTAVFECPSRAAAGAGAAASPESLRVAVLFAGAELAKDSLDLFSDPLMGPPGSVALHHALDATLILTKEFGKFSPVPRMGLKAMLNFSLPHLTTEWQKDKDITLSCWSELDLSLRQLKYAALDAWASRVVGEYACGTVARRGCSRQFVVASQPERLLGLPIPAEAREKGAAKTAGGLDRIVPFSLRILSSGQARDLSGDQSAKDLLAKTLQVHLLPPPTRGPAQPSPPLRENYFVRVAPETDASHFGAALAAPASPSARSSSRAASPTSGNPHFLFKSCASLAIEEAASLGHVSADGWVRLLHLGRFLKDDVRPPRYQGLKLSECFEAEEQRPYFELKAGPKGDLCVKRKQEERKEEKEREIVSPVDDEGDDDLFRRDAALALSRAAEVGHADEDGFVELSKLGSTLKIRPKGFVGCKLTDAFGKAELADEFELVRRGKQSFVRKRPSIEDFVRSASNALRNLCEQGKDDGSGWIDVAKLGPFLPMEQRPPGLEGVGLRACFRHAEVSRHFGVYNPSDRVFLVRSCRRVEQFIREAREALVLYRRDSKWGYSNGWVGLESLERYLPKERRPRGFEGMSLEKCFSVPEVSEAFAMMLVNRNPGLFRVRERDFVEPDTSALWGKEDERTNESKKSRLRDTIAHNFYSLCEERRVGADLWVPAHAISAEIYDHYVYNDCVFACVNLPRAIQVFCEEDYELAGYGKDSARVRPIPGTELGFRVAAIRALILLADVSDKLYDCFYPLGRVGALIPREFRCYGTLPECFMFDPEHFELQDRTKTGRAPDWYVRLLAESCW